MKIALLKTCFWVLSHLVVQKDTFLVAANLYTNKQFKESIAICSSQLNKLDTKDTLYEKFVLLRGSAYMEMGDFNSSLIDYKTLVVLKPKEMPYYINLAYLYEQVKQYPTCLAVLETARKVNPTDVVVLSNLSYYSGQFSRYSDAIKYADEGLKQQTDSAMKSALFNNRGYGCIGLKRFTEALTNINQAIKLDPTNSYAYCYRAIAHIQMKKMETVCADLNKAKELGGVGLTADLIDKYCTRQTM